MPFFASCGFGNTGRPCDEHGKEETFSPHLPGHPADEGTDTYVPFRYWAGAYNIVFVL